MRKSMIAATLAGAALAGAGVAPIAATQAQAQNLQELAPAIQKLLSPKPKLSDSEIQERALLEGVDRALSGGKPTPRTALDSYRAYKTERARLEEENRRRERERIDAVLGILGSIMKSR